jgi:adenylate kinase
MGLSCSESLIEVNKLDGKVILITGAAGTGKSTLVKSVLERARPFKRVDYGQLLLEHKARQSGHEMTYEKLRRDSGAVITPADVLAVDEWVIEQLPTWRSESNIIIDSHSVTKESFGFRVTPYSAQQLARIGFDMIVVLVADPAKLTLRIAANPQGRPGVNSFQSSFQVQLQAAIATLYAITCARPCFAVDTTELDAQELLEAVLNLLEQSGVPLERSAASTELNLR